MRPFMNGFVDELTKVAASPEQERSRAGHQLAGIGIGGLLGAILLRGKSKRMYPDLRDIRDHLPATALGAYLGMGAGTAAGSVAYYAKRGKEGEKTAGIKRMRRLLGSVWKKGEGPQSDALKREARKVHENLKRRGLTLVQVNRMSASAKRKMTKTSAFPQHEQKSAPYDSASSVAQTMQATSGPGAKTGLKTVQPSTPPVESKKAPTPMTTPNYNVQG